MSDTLLLFYHPQSEACEKLKQFIPKDVKIKYIDISLERNLPPTVTSIPCLVINGKDVLLGKKVFDHFSKDEMEYLNFNNKNNNSNTYSTIDDDSVDSNGLFSSLDADDMSKGLPTWTEEKDGKLDMDTLQASRDSEFSVNPPKV